MRERRRGTRWYVWVGIGLIGVVTSWWFWAGPEEPSLSAVLAACDGEPVAQFSGWAGDAPPPGSAGIDEAAVAWFADQRGYSGAIRQVEGAWVVGSFDRPLAVVTLKPGFGTPDVDAYYECQR